MFSIELKHVILDIKVEILIDSDWACRYKSLQNCLGYQSSFWTAEIFLYIKGKLIFPKQGQLTSVHALEWKDEEYVNSLGQDVSQWKNVIDIVDFRAFVPRWLWEQQCQKMIDTKSDPKYSNKTELQICNDVLKQPYKSEKPVWGAVGPQTDTLHPLTAIISKILEWLIFFSIIRCSLPIEHIFTTLQEMPGDVYSDVEHWLWPNKTPSPLPKSISEKKNARNQI